MLRLRPGQYKNWLKPTVSTEGGTIRRRPRKQTKKYEYHGRSRTVREHRVDGNNFLRDEVQQVDMDVCENNINPNPNLHEPNSADEEDFNNIEPQNDQSGLSYDEASDEADVHSNSEEDSQQCNCPHCLETNSSDQEPQTSEFTFDATQGYADKLNLSDKFMPTLDISKFDVLLMILTITMRHGMTGALVEDLLRLVNVIAGRQALPPSNYIFQKIFSVNSSLKYHFICKKCNLYLGEHKSFQSSEVKCPNCQNISNVKPSILNEGTFFVQLSAKQQLQDVVNRAGHHIIARHQRDTEDERFSDIHDGQLFKSLSKEGKPLSNPHSLTVTIGTDGGQVFQNSCRNSMWPVQGFCNELKPTERFRPENMILAGLWFGRNSPDMTAFLKPIADEFKSMETQGVVRTLSTGQIVECPVYTIMCVCDSVAKPKLQNIVQFNGFHGCGYCVQRGVYINDCQQVRYPFNGQKYSLRSEKSVREAMMLASATPTNEKGVKGLSPLLLFSTMHLVFGIPIDFLHAIFLGVVKRMLGFWFDESSSGKRYYIKKFESEIDKRLSAITPPSKISTRPKLISKRSVWKGKDYGNFLLYWGLACLEGYLPSVYLENFRDLVNGIFLLLQESISNEDLMQADMYITRFAKTFNELYGDKNMVYNIHLVTHLVEITKMCGPMAFYSAFSFAGGIGLLGKLVNTVR